MGAVLNFIDRLSNVMSGLGTTVDKRTFASYVFNPMTGMEAEAAYRSSWLVRKIIDVPAKDMTREWRNWQAEKDKIEKLEKEERRLQVRAKCQRCLILARLFGGGGLVLGTDDADLMQPLVPERTKSGGLKYVRALSRYQLVEGAQRTDPADAWVDQPESYSLSTNAGRQVMLHPSRVIPFVGQKAPEGGFFSDASWFWGDPAMQSIGDAVKNADLAQAGFASLIDRAAIDVVKFKELMEQVQTTEGTDRVRNRMNAAKMGMSNWRMLALDTEDEWEQTQVTWAGIPDTLMTFLNVVAGAADIPLTRLLGVSPKGLQSNGDGEERDYQSMVTSWQDDLLVPGLDVLDEVMIRSAIGDKPDDIYYEMAPLSELSEKDAAEVDKKTAETLKIYTDTGILPDAAVAKIAANKIIESGRFPGSEEAFEEHREELENPDNGREEEILTREAAVQQMAQQGKVNPVQADRLITDAAPRALYVCRKVENIGDLKAWAKSQGIPDLADDLHVTIAASRTPIDWIKAGNASDWGSDNDGKLTIAPGGPRVVEPLGGMTAVLLFASSPLVWRHREILEAGASYDFEEYMPHISLSKAPIDVASIEPYRRKIVLGPEIFKDFEAD